MLVGLGEGTEFDWDPNVFVLQDVGRRGFDRSLVTPRSILLPHPCLGLVSIMVSP